MTHEELVQRALRWLKSKHHRVVLTGLGPGELPDAIGWKGWASTLVEVKVSRADYRRDADKYFRRRPEMGVGLFRIYACPPGMLRVEELPPKWGLLEFKPGRGSKLVKRPEPFPDRDRNAELWMLVSALVRATEGWGRKVFGEDAPKGPDGDAGPSMTRILKDLRADNRRLRERLQRAEARLAKHALPNAVRDLEEIARTPTPHLDAFLQEFAPGVEESSGPGDPSEGR